MSVPLPLTFAIFALISTYFLSDPKLFRPIAFSVDFNNSDCAAFEIRLQNVCPMCRGVHPSLNHFFRTVIVLCKILAIKNFVIRCIPSASVRSGMGKTSYDFIGSYFGFKPLATLISFTLANAAFASPFAANAVMAKNAVNNAVSINNLTTSFFM